MDSFRWARWRSRMGRQRPRSLRSPSQLPATKWAVDAFKNFEPPRGGSIYFGFNCWPRNRNSMVLFSAEDFLQQIRRLRRGISANLRFFGGKHVEDAVESLLDDILVKIEFIGDCAASRSVFYNVVVLLNDANALHRAVHDRGEGGSEVV